MATTMSDDAQNVMSDDVLNALDALRSGVNVHPAISTVTYLTDSGAPTLVLNHRAPILYEDLDGFRGRVLEGYLSYPTVGTERRRGRGKGREGKDELT